MDIEKIIKKYPDAWAKFLKYLGYEEDQFNLIDHNVYVDHRGRLTFGDEHHFRCLYDFFEDECIEFGKEILRDDNSEITGYIIRIYMRTEKGVKVKGIFKDDLSVELEFRAFKVAFLLLQKKIDKLKKQNQTMEQHND